MTTTQKTPWTLAIACSSLLLGAAMARADVSTASVEALTDPVESALGTSTIGIISPAGAALEADLLNRLRAGFQLNDRADHWRVKQQLRRYVGKQQFVDTVMSRAERYLFLAVAEAERRGIPTDLALLPVIESAYDPLAISRSGAAGIWQFVPDTARLYGLRHTSWFDARRDPLESTRAAYDYLSKLYGMFGDWELALAAYNGGPGTVQRAQQLNRRLGKPTDYWSLTLPSEPSQYVPRFLALVSIFKRPEVANVVVRSLPNAPYFRTINPHTSMSLSEVAQLLEQPIERLRELNPGLRRDRLAPQGPYMLHIPNDVDLTKELALMSYASATALLDSQASPQIQTVAVSTSAAVPAMRQHIISRGDTWYALSKRYGLSVAQLQAANPELVTAPLVVGQSLQVPSPAAAAFAAHWPAAELHREEAYHRLLNSESNEL